MAVFFLAVLAAACRPVLVRAPNAELAIAGVTIVDVETAATTPDRTILVGAGRILAVGPADRTEIPEGARVVAGAGLYAIPGLWDMHVHAWTPAGFADLFLDAGITGVREMGTGMDPAWGGSTSAWTWRDSVRAGTLAGPRIVAGGLILNGGDPEAQGVHFFKGIRTAEEARAWVDSLAARGADFVKVYSGLSPDAFRAIAVRSAEARLPIAGHVPARVGSREAIRRGMRSIEHLYDVPVSASSEEQSIRDAIVDALLAGDIPTADAQLAELALTGRIAATLDRDRLAELFASMLERRTYLTPTLVVAADTSCPGVPPRGATVGQELPGFIAPFVQPRERSAKERADGCARYDLLEALVRAASEAGVPLLAGTDGPNPGVVPGTALHDELSLLVEAGLTPAEALVAATAAPARYFEATDSLGAIAEGRLADLVLLGADPLASIENTRRIAAVIVGGRVVRGDSLVGVSRPKNAR